MTSVDIHPKNLRDKILQLKSQISDLIAAQSMYNDDLYLLQWLRVNKFEVSQAEKKIRSAQLWRDEFDEPDRGCTDLELEEHYGLHQCRAKDGRVVLAFNSGKVDFVDIFNKFPADRHERFLLRKFIDLELAMIEANRSNFNGDLSANSANGIMVLSELGSVSFRAMMTPRIATFYIGLVRKISIYFPGTFQTLYWINAPSALRVVIQAAVRFLNGPFFTLQVVSGQKEIEEKIYCVINQEELNGAI